MSTLYSNKTWDRAWDTWRNMVKRGPGNNNANKHWDSAMTKMSDALIKQDPSFFNMLDQFSSGIAKKGIKSNQPLKKL